MSTPLRLQGRRLALGVTGSIAAYKAVELLRLLQAEGADVHVLMTRSAAAFVGPLTFETLSHHPVDVDVMALQPDGTIGHIETAAGVDAIVVAPATAHWLAGMAIGLAGDPLTAACLAASCPVVVAPAMDGGMYDHPATRDNVARLRETFGYAIVEPGSGPLASGRVGPGRLAEPARIVDAVIDAIGRGAIRRRSAGREQPGEPRRDLEGRHIVVTAGGTAEPIDPVRFVGNRSSGKMGVAIAEAAAARGAQVTLIVGRIEVALPSAAEVVTAETTAAMGEALDRVMLTDASRPDALVMAAAVADFRPAHPAGTKLHRGDGLTLELEPTPDLLAGLRRSLDSEGARQGNGTHPAPVLVGFAAETGSLERAADKLASKGLDLLVGNDVAEPGSGFGTDTNRVTIYRPDAAPEPWPLLTKREVADRLLDLVAGLLEASPQHPAGTLSQQPQEVHP